MVDSLALSKMISNDIVLPVLLRHRRVAEVYSASLASRRLGIVAVVALGFLWAWTAHGQPLLVELGLLSFIAIAQCGPAVLGGLYWRRGGRKGVCAGISLGFGLVLHADRAGARPARVPVRGAASPPTRTGGSSR